MFAKTIEVTETVRIRKYVNVEYGYSDVSLDNLEPYALVEAMQKTPNYKEAGWELVESAGFEFKEVTNQNR